MTIKKWLIAIFLGLFLSYFMRDLSIPGLPKMHDVNPHIARSIAYHTALKDGQFPPMWAKEVLGGIGSPVLMLNYQLPYMLGELWQSMGASTFDSFKLTLGITYIASGLLMYFALIARYGTVAAWVGAIVYSLAPYRFVDIYVRGALGESMSFLFPPLLLYGFLHKSRAVTILGWSGLFLTHPVASAAFSAFYLGYVLIFEKKENFVGKLKYFFGPYLVALCIALFNLLPTVLFTKDTYYSPSLSDTILMFPTMGQLLSNYWGYGVSLPGPNDGMSFSMGIVAALILVIAIPFSLRKKNILLRYLVVMSGLTIFLILPGSKLLYEWWLGNIIDFPWRLLLCIVFASTWTSAIIIEQIQNYKWQKVLAIIITTMMIIPAMSMAHTNAYYDSHYDLKYFARETGDSYGEYAPKTRATRDSSPFGLRAEYISGAGEIEWISEKSNEKHLKLKTTSAGEVRINTAYFPIWQLPSNCYVTVRQATHIDDSGLMACFVDKGESEIRIIFRAPTAQKIGNLITLAGIAEYLWIIFQSYYLHLTKKMR